jgi:hypothetical protein
MSVSKNVGLHYDGFPDDPLNGKTAAVNFRRYALDHDSLPALRR